MPPAARRLFPNRSTRPRDKLPVGWTADWPDREGEPRQSTKMYGIHPCGVLSWIETISAPQRIRVLIQIDLQFMTAAVVNFVVGDGGGGGWKADGQSSLIDQVTVFQRQRQHPSGELNRIGSASSVIETTGQRFVHYSADSSVVSPPPLWRHRMYLIILHEEHDGHRLVEMLQQSQQREYLQVYYRVREVFDGKVIRTESDTESHHPFICSLWFIAGRWGTPRRGGGSFFH